MGKRKFDRGDQLKVLSGPLKNKAGFVIEIRGFFGEKKYVLVTTDGHRTKPIKESNLVPYIWH